MCTVQLHTSYQFQRSAAAVSGNMPQFHAVAGLQKNTVVANDEKRARYFRKSGFEKSDGKNIQVIGRLVKQQYRRMLRQSAGNLDPFLFSARKRFPTVKLFSCNAEQRKKRRVSLSVSQNNAYTLSGNSVLFYAQYTAESH